MADSLEDIGSYELFPFDANWATNPSMTMILARNIIKFPGTTVEMESYFDYVPEAWTLSFTLSEYSDIYDFQDFFHERRGRWGAFWVRIPIVEFTLQEGILSGASSMFVNRNYANLNYQGDERIWFGMQNGDILTRKVSSLTDDEDNDRISLAVATSIDRNLTVSDPYIIGRLLLARFQEDSLIMDFETDKVVSIQVTFYELVNEYP